MRRCKKAGYRLCTHHLHNAKTYFCIASEVRSAEEDALPRSGLVSFTLAHLGSIPYEQTDQLCVSKMPQVPSGAAQRSSRHPPSLKPLLTWQSP